MYAGMPAAFAPGVGTLAATDLGTYTATASTAAPTTIVIQGAVDKDGTVFDVDPRHPRQAGNVATPACCIGGTA